MTFTVEITAAAEKQLRQIAKVDQRRIAQATRALADDPRPAGCVTLSAERGVFRIRVGNYRVIYHVRDRDLLVLVVRITKREDAYKRLNELLKRLSRP